MSHTLAMEWQKLRPFGKTSRTIALTIGLAVALMTLTFYSNQSRDEAAPGPKA